ncbi:MAG: hypothetical protein ACTS2F_21410 [Thainema sp.]
MAQSPPIVPEEMTFQQAISISQELLDQADQHTYSEAELQTAIATLVASENGARGFFVTYLTGDSPLADQPTPAILTALEQSPQIVAELLVKNLAMSSAMAVAHRRNEKQELAAGSERVKRRTQHLMQQLDIADLAARARALQTSAQGGQGDYAQFLDRWGYDAEQRQVIDQAFEQVLTEPV